MKKEMRELAIREGKIANFKCGSYEVLRIAYEAHCYCEELNARDNLVLAGLRITSTIKHLRKRCRCSVEFLEMFR